MFREVARWVKKRSQLVRIVLVLMLFTILFMNLNLAEVIEAFKQARKDYLLFAALILIPSFIVQIMKWNYLLGTLENKPGIKNAAISLVGGYFLGAVSPARAGELARGVLMPGQSKVKVASLTVVDKGVNQIIIMLGGILAISTILPSRVRMLLLLAEIIVIVLLLNLHRVKNTVAIILKRFSKSPHITMAFEAFDSISRGRMLVVFFVSLFLYFVWISQFALIIMSFTDIPFFTAARVVPMVYLIQLVMPLSIGDLGIKEVAMVGILTQLGVATAVSFSASISHNAVAFTFPSLVGGLICLFGATHKDRTVVPS